MLRREKKKKKEILSDKIANLLTVAPSADLEDDHAFGTKPKTVTREELESDGDSAEEAALSNFRKQNASLLADLSGRYAGEVTSRKDLGLQDSDDSIQIDSDDVAGDSDDNEKDNEEGDGSVKSDEEQDESGDFDAENGDESGDNISGSDQENESEEDSDLEGSQDGFDLSELGGPSKEKGLDAEFKHFKDKDVSEEVEKGKCVRNQLSMWESLLEMRINIQKCLISANKMPLPETFKKLRKEGGDAFNNAVNKNKGSVTSLMTRLMELQSILLSKYPETKDLFNKKDVEDTQTEDPMDEEIPSDTDSVSSEKEVVETPKVNKKRKLADYSEELSNRFSTYTKYRNSVIQKWNDKTRVASNLKNQPAPTSIISQIQFILNDTNKLTKRTQLKRTKYDIIGEDKLEHEDESLEIADKNNQNNAHEDYCTEIFDDDDFYHQLLRELIEHKSSDISDPIQLSRQWIMLQQMRSKMKRKIDTRATKGRRIRYAVHSKLVNFMAPEPNLDWTDEMKNELYASLFGKQFEGNTDGIKSDKTTNGNLEIMS